MHLKFVETESTFDYFQATREYLEAHGKPVAFYSDKHGVFRVNQTGALGIAARNDARPDATYDHYRCQFHFGKLAEWLREKGVKSRTPLHTLRKEFGSQICDREGIYAASRALRHADITITSQHYVDKKKRVVSGLGHLLKDDQSDGKITTLAGSRKEPAKRKAGR